MATRWWEHVNLLRKNKHDNGYLQSSYNKHGEASFCFVVLEEILELGKLDSREIYWISTLDSMKGKRGWNMREGGTHGLYGPQLREKVSKGIRASAPALASRHARRKTYTLVSPVGDVVTFVGMRKFCNENGINTGHFYALINGESHSVKGWTLPISVVRPKVTLWFNEAAVDPLERNCPVCNRVIRHTQKCHRDDGERKALKCRSCATSISRQRSIRCKYPIAEKLLDTKAADREDEPEKGLR